MDNHQAAEFDLRKTSPTWVLVRIRATQQQTEMISSAAHRMVTNGQAEYIDRQGNKLDSPACAIAGTLTVELTGSSEVAQ